VGNDTKLNARIAHFCKKTVQESLNIDPQYVYPITGGQYGHFIYVNKILFTLLDMHKATIRFPCQRR